MTTLTTAGATAAATLTTTPPHGENGTVMTTTTIEAGALDKALRTLKLSGMLATIEAAWPRPAPGNSAAPASSRSCAKTRSPAASPCP